MRTFACVYKSGGPYTEEHVQVLKRMVEEYLPSTERFVCLTDVEGMRDILTVPLDYDLRGKYSMQEVFKVSGQVVVTGLDTVFIKNCDSLYDLAEQCNENQFYMIRAFNRGRTYANGIMIWNGDWSRLLFDYPVKKVYTYRLEQRYTIHKLQQEGAEIKILNDDFSGIYSYKHHCKQGLPEDASVVLFHGDPRPHLVQMDWNKYWK